MLSTKVQATDIITDSNTCRVKYQPHPDYLCFYRNKEYKIDLILFRGCSNYFYENYNKFVNSKSFPLRDEENYPDLTSHIQIFIDFCHGNEIKITNNNALELNFLSKIYSVESLHEKTKLYINQNHNHLFNKILQFDQQFKEFEIDEIKESIATNFVDYIQNDKNLKSLPIKILYDILVLYNNSENKKEKDNDKIFDFLCECLDKDRSSSVLFSVFDFGENQPKYIQKLIEKYTNKLDFSFINREVCQTIVQQNIEIDNLKKELEKMKELLDCFKPKIIIFDQDDLTKQCIGMKDQKEIIIPSGLKIISPLLFAHCENIEKVTIPSSVVSIENFAFFDCGNLKEVVFEPDSTLKYIKEAAFRCCKSLTTIKLPKSVETIENYSFIECSSLNNIEFPSNLRFIGQYAFYKCTELCTPIILPLSLDYVGIYAFSGCTKLKELKILSPNTHFDYYAFYGCSALEFISFAKGTEYIYINCFNGCVELKTIELPDSIVAIYGGAFWNCCKLEKINIPASLKLISEHAFHNTPISKQDYIEKLPKYVNIGKYAFEK